MYTAGKLYLRGVVPSDTIASQIIARGAAIVGPENVIDQYTRIAGAPVPSSAPLYVGDLVLFDSDSAVLRPEYRQLLDLGVVLMNQNPKVTIVIRGHTDSRGSAEHNLELSQKRVAAAIAYFASKGVSVQRLSGEALGEAEPINLDGSGDALQVNRRVEFIIQGLLD